MKDHYYHGYPPDVLSDMREEKAMTVIKSTTDIVVIVWTQSQPSWNGEVLAREAARSLIDNMRFFWDDCKDRLLWKGPAAELMGDAPPPPKRMSK